MFVVESYAAVRRFVFVEGHSRREAARVFGLSRETVAKMCRFSLPPGYTRKEPAAKPKLGPLLPVIDAILEVDRTAPLKQRHTAKRVFERLRDEHGFAGGYTVEKDHVRSCRARGRETFVPLAHPPGHPRYLLRLIELELIDRERRTIERRIRAARFPAVKSFDTFDFAAIPDLNKMLVLELARCEYVLRRENVIALGNSGTGKTHVALALGLAACQKGFTVAFTTAASLVSQLMEARDERRLLKFQRDLAAVKLLIVNELGYVPLSPTGAELLFEVFSQRYERGSTIVTSNLPFEDWTQVLGSERLTGALLDRITHHVSILAMNGDSYRLKQSAGQRRRAHAGAEQNQAIDIVDPDTREITAA